VLVQETLLEAGDTLYLVPLKDVTREAPEGKAIQLTAVHGLLLPENGNFVPEKAGTAHDVHHVIQALSGKGAANSAEPVTRQAFANAIGELMATSNVSLRFSAAEGDGRKPITRSEAAQILAEFLHLRALASLSHERQTLTWNSVRPTTPASKVDVTSPLQ